MMFLSRLKLNGSRVAQNWVANTYRVHQRLNMACEGDPRLLFRIEDTDSGMQVIVQSHIEPRWGAVFDTLAVLAGPPEHKPFTPSLGSGARYRFRLLANPTVKRAGRRLGLLREEDQRAWLKRKLQEAGAELVACAVIPQGLRRSAKGVQGDQTTQTHCAVLFEGLLEVRDPTRLQQALECGLGAAKGYGFGLLSLAPPRSA